MQTDSLKELSEESSVIKLEMIWKGEIGQMDRNPLYERLTFWIETKNYPAALRELRQELANRPDDPQILFWLGICLADIRDYQEAELHLKHVAEIDPAYPDIQETLQLIQKKRHGEEVERPFAIRYFHLDEPVEIKKKECPTCYKKVDRSSWTCGYCKTIFWRRVIVQLGIVFGIASLGIWILSGWYMSVMGVEFYPAKIVNKANGEGERVQYSDVEWNCIGLGLFQASGRGFHAQVKGKIKNNGERTIEKATCTIVFRYEDGTDITFVWFDILSWKPGEELQFEFPGISPPMRAEVCELRTEMVKLAASEATGEIQPQFYVPQSDHFPAYRFSQGEKTLDERLYGIYKPTDPWTFAKLLQVYFDMLPAFLFNYFCVLLAVILVNICDPERVWNTELRLDAIASGFVVIGFVVINLLQVVLSAAFGMLGLFFAMVLLFLFGIKLFLFYLFFRRSFGFTFIMVIFYVCLTLSGMGLWYNITGPPQPEGMGINPQFIQSPEDKENSSNFEGGMMPMVIPTSPTK